MQHSILALSRACPYSPIPTQRLFEHITLTQPRQIIALNRRILLEAQPCAQYIKSIKMHCWDADAEVFLNTLKLVPEVQRLDIWVGPASFLPEHLKDMLRSPIVGLRDFTLRFRPYVQRATYLQFLKGSYFDSTLDCIASWPPKSLDNLSISQDPLKPEMVPGPSFAQPIVFFQLQSLIPLSMDAPPHFRLSLPNRPVAPHLCARSNKSTIILDLSHCKITRPDVSSLLAHFISLEHLILDDCSVLPQDASPEDWSAFGKQCALAGSQRAREREKKVKAWLDTVRAQEAATGMGRGAPTQRGKKGRKGLSTATISLRHIPIEGHATSTQFASTSFPAPPLHVQTIRILPILPTISSICLKSPRQSTAVAREEFAAGWKEGIAQVSALRQRLWLANLRHGIWVMTYEHNQEKEQALVGLVRVQEQEDFRSPVDCPPPLLCFMEEETHVGCGHAAAARSRPSGLLRTT